MQQGHKGMSFEIVTFLISHSSKMRRFYSQKASLIISLSLTRTVMMVTHPGSWPPSLCHWKHTMFSHDTACAGGAGAQAWCLNWLENVSDPRPLIGHSTPCSRLWLADVSLIRPRAWWPHTRPDCLANCNSDCLLLPDWNKNCFHFLISSMPR